MRQLFAICPPLQISYLEKLLTAFEGQLALKRLHYFYSFIQKPFTTGNNMVANQSFSVHENGKYNRNKPKDASQATLTFSGCGMIAPYQLGSCLAIKLHTDLFEKAKWLGGTSAGCFFPLIGLMDVSKWSPFLDNLLVEILKQRHYCTWFLGPELTKFVNGFTSFLPDDIHSICSGRVHFSTTLMPMAKSLIINDFESKEDVASAVLCSTHIPYFSGILLPKYKGQMAIDGLFSQNIIKFDEDTIISSPFSSQGNTISPKHAVTNVPVFNISNTEISMEPANLTRILKLCYLNSIAESKQLFTQGYNDAYDYLSNNGWLIKEKCQKYGSIYGELMDLFIKHEQSDKKMVFEPIKIAETVQSNAEKVMNWLLN